MSNETKDDSQVKVRMPAPLKTWLQHQALDNRRTLNAEVVLRLEECKRQQEAPNAT